MEMFENSPCQSGLISFSLEYAKAVIIGGEEKAGLIGWSHPAF